MVYRPRIPNDIHERIEKNTTGQRINENEIYIDSIRFLYNESGEYSEWLERIDEFAERNNISNEKAIELIVCRVLDDSGHIEETFRKPRLFSNDKW